MYTYRPLFFQVRGPLPVQQTPQVHLHPTPNRYVVEQGDSTSPQKHVESVPCYRNFIKILFT